VCLTGFFALVQVPVFFFLLQLHFQEHLLTTQYCCLAFYNKCNYFHGSSFMRLHSIFKLMHLDLPLVQVLLEGLPPNALNEDIERFLSGCKFVPSSIRTFVKLV